MKLLSVIGGVLAGLALYLICNGGCNPAKAPPTPRVVGKPGENGTGSVDGAKVTVAYQDWDDGLTFVIYTDIDPHDPGGLASGGMGGSSTYQGFYGKITSPDGRLVEWHGETADGKTGIITINMAKYDLSNGPLFLVSTVGVKPQVRQLKRDLLSLPKGMDGITTLAKEDQEVKQFIANASKQTLLSQEPKLRVTLKGHTGTFWSVAFSPDGKTLVSGNEDMTVKLWDVTTGHERTNLKGHTFDVTSVSVSPDGKTLASGSGDPETEVKPGEVKLWDVTTGKERASLKGHSGTVWSVSFSPDGKTLASGSWDRTVKLWDLTTGKERASLNVDTQVYSVAFSPDGKTLASGSRTEMVKLWDVTSGKILASLKGHNEAVTSVAFSPDGKTLASGSFDKTVKLWDLASGRVRGSLDGHTTPLRSVAFSPDGKTLASASGRPGQAGEVKLWDVATGKEWASLKGHTEGVWCVAYSPNGKTLASASADRTIKLWDVPVAKKADE